MFSTCTSISLCLPLPPSPLHVFFSFYVPLHIFCPMSTPLYIQAPSLTPPLHERSTTTPTLPALHSRGIETITSIYGTLWTSIFSTFGPHRGPVGLHELTVVYGLYLSDFTYLTALETEVVAYTCITCQGLRGPGLWHVRGLGRVLGARGVDDEVARVRRVKDVLRGVKVAAALVVEFCGDEMVARARLDMWPNVGDVLRELGGWGED